MQLITSFSWTTSLPAEGTSSIQFQVADSADNNGSLTEQNYTLDQTAPSQAVTLSSIKLSTDTGSSNTDFITNTAEQTISAELNASLSSGDVLYASVDDGANWAKIYTDSNLSGSISFSWTTSLPAEGNSSIQFQVVDSADNNGSLTEQNYTLDITAPSLAVKLDSLSFDNDTGTADDDFITNTAEQTISAELNAILGTGDVLYASVDDGANWAKIYTDANLSDSTSFSWTTSLPAEGTSSIQFQVADSADNNGSLTEQSYTLDQTAPSQAVTLSSIKLSTDTGSSNTDFITNTAEQTISAELNAILGTGDVLYASIDDGANWAKIYTDSNLSDSTSFSWTTSLPAEGNSSIQFQVADSADNNGSLTEQNYTLDQTAPSQAVTLSSIKLSTDTGSSNTDFITNTAEQTISAELNASLSSGDVLYASVDDGASWAKIYTDANLSDSTSFSWTTSLPTESTSSIQFQVADAADNRGDITQQSYTLDTTAPTQSVSSIAFSVDSGTAGDLVTNTAAQTITATLSAALGTDEILFGAVSLDEAGNPAWTNITDKVTGLDISWDTTLSAGENDIQFIVEDAAGNSGEPVKQSYFFDNEAPQTNTAGTTASAAEASVATLDAANSTDNYGIASYEWTQVQSDGSALSADDIKLSIANANDATTTAITPGITDDDIDSLSFYFSLRITDVAGNYSGATATLTVSNTYTTPDITASIGTAPNFDQLSLSWPTTTGLAYNLYRSSDSGCDLSATDNCAGYQLYAALDLSGGAYVDTGLEFFTPYYYWLQAQLNGEVVSLSSTPLEANTTGPSLNDTGVTQGGDYPSGFDSLGGGTACNGGYLVDDNGDVIADPDNHSGNSTFVPFAAEDCELGRDADDTLNDDSDGNAGFSFTRLNIDGSEYSGNGVYSEEPWACVLDNITGLIWEVKTNDNTLRDRDEGFTWYDSSTADGTPSDQDTGDFVDYVNGNAEVNSGNGLCGQTNWRLPTVQELVGISDFSTYEPVVDTSYFPNSRTGAYEWSWTADLNSDTENLPNFAWLYNYYIGSIRSGGNSLGATSNSFYVRLVSSSEAVKSYFNDYSSDGGRYTDHEDGTVSDNRTGLMWMKCIYGQAHNLSDNSCGGTGAGAGGTWQEAFAKAAAINEGVGTFGYTDWRLPNMKELLSLVDLSSFQPPINQAIFPNTDGQSQWTSTLSAQDGGDAALAVGLGADPEFGLLGKTTTTTRVRLVRDDVNTPRIFTLNINGDNVINSEDELANIPISGSTSDVEDGQQITLVIDTTTFYVAVSSDTVNDTIDLSTISDGTALAVTADVSDQAGKEANQFTSTLLKDTTPPSIDLVVAADNIINSTEASSATITGTTEGVEDGQTISIAINDNADPVVKITSTATVTDNAFNITNLNLSGLADDTGLSLTADVADAAGNPATSLSFDDITKDTVAPTITIDSVATDGIINASEQSAVVINGTTSGAADGQTVSLALSDGTKEPLNRSVLLSRSRHGEILSRCRGGFWCLSLALSYFFIALMPFLRPFLHNRRNTAY